ncbi:MAG: hypothetical protein EA411_01140 [Saprospirales bacterium]|nr:MAG: hypothetical protein EA411_01140 [Saprospirales bacterium]
MKEELLKDIPRDINLVEVSAINSNLYSSDSYLENRVRPTSLEIKVEKNLGFSPEEELAKCLLNFEISGLDKSNEPLGINFQIGIEFFFKVNELTKYAIKEGTKTQISAELGSSILAIAYSTSRGIVLERTNNTFFNGIILPVINVAEFLREDPKENSVIENG